jgi:hypothetical protein
MFVAVTGRTSKPSISLSSAPALYTQDELFSFLLGAEPGGDPGTQARDAAAGATAAAAQTVLGHALKQFLPLDLDLSVVRYQPATSSSSSAITLGGWVRRHLFAGLTHRQTPLPVIENEWEGEVEWWMSRDWLLHASYGDRQVGNVDLTHSWRW